MTINELLDKFLRFPWDIQQNGKFGNNLDREIWHSLTGQLGFDPIFGQAPKNAGSVQAIA